MYCCKKRLFRPPNKRVGIMADLLLTDFCLLPRTHATPRLTDHPRTPDAHFTRKPHAHPHTRPHTSARHTYRTPGRDPLCMKKLHGVISSSPPEKQIRDSSGEWEIQRARATGLLLSSAPEVCCECMRLDELVRTKWYVAKAQGNPDDPIILIPI